MAEKSSGVANDAALNGDRWRAPGHCDNPSCSHRIRELEDELSRLRSVGLDVLKQRGQWQVGREQPSDLGLEFDDLFNHEVEEKAEEITRETSMTNSEARLLLSKTFQDVYNSCRTTVLKKLRDTLSRVLELPERSASDEDLYDVCRAYGLLVHAANMRQSSEHVTCVGEVNSRLQSSVPQVDLKELTAGMSELSWKMLNTVPPVVSTTITDSSFSSEWHDKEMRPRWDISLKEPSYELVYYRPILFYSYEGKVMQKGWVGNKPLNDLAKGSNWKGYVSTGSNSRQKNTDYCASDVGNENKPCVYPEREKLYKSYHHRKTHKNNVGDGDSNRGFELIDLDPESSRIRDLESTVLNPYVAEEDDEESDASAEGELQPEPIGLRKFM